MDDYETTSDLNEQIHCERMDADMLQAQYEAESRYYAAQRAKGICMHDAHLSHRVPAFYSAESIAYTFTQSPFGNVHGFTGDQSDIGEGNWLCRDCGLVERDPLADDR